MNKIRRVGTSGNAAADVKLGKDVFRDLEKLTLELNESIRAAERAATTARHARIL